MTDFGDTHIFKSFKTFKEKETWWVGRLVRVKQTLNTLYMKTPSLEEVGIVVQVLETSVGCHLEVYYAPSGAKSWILTSDVYSQTDKK